MNLYIVRHAIAEQREGTATEQEDSQRPLTDKGKKQFRQAAKGLAEMGIEMDLILTSPYLRAADTANILRKQLGLGKDQLVTMEDIAPGGNFGRVIAEITKNYGSMQSIAIVGHEPSISGLISTLVSGGPELPISMSKGGVCCLSADKLGYGRCATLEWLMTQDALRAING